MRTQQLIIPIMMLLLSACDTNERRSDPVPSKEQVVDTNETRGYAANGINEVYDRNGVLVMRGERINGQREGGWESYFPDGTLRSRGTFINGIMQGPTTVYHENGAIFYTGWYLNGMPVKEWTFYDPDGHISKIVTYSEDGVKLEERDLKE